MFENLFNRTPKQTVSETEKNFDALVEKIDKRVAETKTKESAITYIKELERDLQAQLDREEKNPDEGGSLLMIQAVKRLMTEFEITELEVNTMLGHSWLASDREGLDMGENSKVKTTPYPKTPGKPTGF